MGALEMRAMDIRRQFSDMCDMKVTISDRTFNCHSFPLYTKSTYFKNFVASCKKEWPLQVDLSELPGGWDAFELVMNFCYDFTVAVTATNVLIVLSAAEFLGFSEDMVTNNLCMLCKKFIETEGASSIQGILSMLSSMGNGDCENVRVLFQPKLITRLIVQAISLQQIGHGNRDEVTKLLVGLTELRPDLVSAILQDFESQGVNFVNSGWWAGAPANWFTMANSNSDANLNACTIISYLATALESSINLGKVQADTVHPKLLVLLLSPFFLTRATVSRETIMACVSARLSSLKASDILCLSPEVLLKLVSPLFSSLRNGFIPPIKRQEVEQMAQLVDEYLQLGAEQNVWTLGFMENFKLLAECVPLNARHSHDSLYDAVASFARSFSQGEASSLWELIDVTRMSETKMEAAIESTLPPHPGFLAALLRREHDMHKSLKRKVASLEERESSRRRIIVTPVQYQYSIFIRSLEGRTFPVVVSPDNTIQSIKTLLERRSGLQCGRSWWLVYGGRNLCDSSTLAHYGIQKDCTLCVRVSLVKVGEVASEASP